MDLKNCSTALFVKDIEDSKKFYSEILGLSIQLDFGKNVIYSCGFAIWEIQNSHIIPSVLGVNNISNSRINRFELYFETETLPQDYEHLKKNNIPFLNEIHEEPWGQRTIRFFDPDKHLIEIGESMKQFITRFHNLGMTIEEIYKKTSVPTEEITRLLKE
jgi:catechol 2,3-dioxygenase-like lactoylglutathione lyase family enzyme